jgi:hypothetical protein
MQSASAVQVVLQELAPHAYGVQAVVAAEGQEPAPSQLAAEVAVPAEQLAPRHCAVGNAQDAGLPPSQLPPQTPLPPQALRDPCGDPVTATH